MVKILFILLVALASSLASAQLKPKPPTCIIFYERSTSLVIGSHNFTGSSTGTDVATFNTPFFYKLSDAESSTAVPNGRVFGSYALSSSSGSWSFNFFATNSWITATYGFGDSSTGAPNVVTGGNGCYLGEAGTLISTIVPNTGSLFILEWKICPQVPRQCPVGKA
jgi:hypothetical protein